jgi:hypothetical protein
MEQTNELLNNIETVSIARLIDQIVSRGYRAAQRGGSRPTVNILLATGREFRGEIVRSGNGVVIVQIQSDSRATTVAYIRLDEIAAVVFELVAEPPLVAPGAFELTRRWQQAAATALAPLQRAIEATVATLSDNGRSAAMTHVPAIEAALQRICSDAIGVQALASVAIVQLDAGSEGNVKLSDTTLRITVPAAVDGAWTLSETVDHIEKAL